jgi:hypothetical protein
VMDAKRRALPPDNLTRGARALESILRRRHPDYVWVVSVEEPDGSESVGPLSRSGWRIELVPDLDVSEGGSQGDFSTLAD